MPECIKVNTVFLLPSLGISLFRSLVIACVELAGFEIIDEISHADFVIGLEDDPELAKIDRQRRITFMASAPKSDAGQEKWFNPATLTHWASPSLTLTNMLTSLRSGTPVEQD